MPRFNCWLPADVHARAIEELPADVSWSGLLREGIEHTIAQVKGCDHELVECQLCHQRGSPAELSAAPRPPESAAGDMRTGGATGAE